MKKPIMYNETGSKEARTLDSIGAPTVPLKDNHAQSRERASIMTCVTSSPSDCVPERLPLEMLIRAKTHKKLKNMKPPADLRVSLQYAEKGSYREANILAYLREHLAKWTEERAAQNDFRILYLDVARSHLVAAVSDFAWNRGYVVLYHYGCTTAVAQVNDTDLHGAFEATYIDFEQKSFYERHLYDPGNIGRTSEEVLQDLVATWRCLDHRRAQRGHYRTGLANRLDGSDDALLTREALDMWREAEMHVWRPRAINEVDDALQKNPELSFSNWKQFVRHPEDAGVYEEGEEFEGALEKGEKLWHDPPDEEEIAKQALEEEAAILALESEDGSSKAVVLAGDTAEDVDEATRALERIQKLKRLRDLSKDLALPVVSEKSRDDNSRIQRGLRAKTTEDQEVNEVLRRTLREKTLKEHEAIAEIRKHKKNFAARRNRAKVALLRQKARAKQEMIAAENAKKKEAMKALPLHINAGDCGQGKKNAGGQTGKSKRIQALERLKLGSPSLALEDESRWVVVRNAYAEKVGKDHKEKSVIL